MKRPGGKSSGKRKYKKRIDTNETRKLTKISKEKQNEIKALVKHRVTADEESLDDKKMLFIAEYLADFDKTRAALACGYSKTCALEMATRILKIPAVKRVVERFQAEDMKRCQLTREEVLRQLYYCATRSAQDFIDEDGRIITDVNRLTMRAQNTIDGIDQTITITPEGGERVHTRLRLVPKAEAINMSLKHMGLYAPEKQEVVVSAGLDFNKLVREDVPQDTIEAELGESNDPPRDPSKDQGATNPEGKLPKD